MICCSTSCTSRLFLKSPSDQVWALLAERLSGNSGFAALEQTIPWQARGKEMGSVFHFVIAINMDQDAFLCSQIEH